MHSQMGFQLHQSHSLTVTGLKGGKKSKYWVSVGSVRNCAGPVARNYQVLLRAIFFRKCVTRLAINS